MVPVILTAIGIYGALPVFWALPPKFTAAAAGGIGLINSLGNLGGFAAPYATGALADLTGSNRSGMWVIGVVMTACAVLVVVLRPASSPDLPESNGEYPRSQPTG